MLDTMCGHVLAKFHSSTLDWRQSNTHSVHYITYRLQGLTRCSVHYITYRLQGLTRCSVECSRCSTMERERWTLSVEVEREAVLCGLEEFTPGLWGKWSTPSHSPQCCGVQDVQAVHWQRQQVQDGVLPRSGQEVATHKRPQRAGEDKAAGECVGKWQRNSLGRGSVSL